MSTDTSTVNPQNSTETIEPGDDQDVDESGEEKPQKGTEVFGITTQHQMSFGEGGLEPAQDAVETTLNQFDVDIEEDKGESRIDTPKASSIMCDDRPTREKKSEGSQANLFTSPNEDQQTLTGEPVKQQCKFED